MAKSDIDLPKKATRGFASMSPEKRLEVARKGGKSVPNEKRAFSINRALAAEAGKKGGASSPLAEQTSFEVKLPITQALWLGLSAEPAVKKIEMKK